MYELDRFGNNFQKIYHTDFLRTKVRTGSRSGTTFRNRIQIQPGNDTSRSGSTTQLRRIFNLFHKEHCPCHSHHQSYFKVLVACCHSFLFIFTFTKHTYNILNIILVECHSWSHCFRSVEGLSPICSYPPPLPPPPIPVHYIFKIRSK